MKVPMRLAAAAGRINSKASLIPPFRLLLILAVLSFVIFYANVASSRRRRRQVNYNKDNSRNTPTISSLFNIGHFVQQTLFGEPDAADDGRAASISSTDDANTWDELLSASLQLLLEDNNNPATAAAGVGRRVRFFTDEPRNQSTVNFKATSWANILRAKNNTSLPALAAAAAGGDGTGADEADVTMVTDALWMPITAGAAGGVDDQKSKGGFVYSAFLDIRFTPPFVRVLGVVPRNVTKLFCKFHFKEDDSSSVIGTTTSNSSSSTWMKHSSSTQYYPTGRRGEPFIDDNAAASTLMVTPATHVQAELEPQWQQMVGLGFPYLAVFIKCPLLWDKEQLQHMMGDGINNKLAVPTSVSVYPDEESSRRSKTAAGNNLLVIRREGRKKPADSTKDSPSPKQMTYCVRHLWNNYKDVVQLVEFLELHSILGVSQFHLYGHTFSPQVECILKAHYSSSASSAGQMNSIKRTSLSSKVEFHNWELPFVGKTEVTEAGPETAMNDCLYRSMAAGADYVANGDLDEIFLPYNDSITHHHHHHHHQLGRDDDDEGALLHFLKSSQRMFPRAGAFEFSRKQFPRQYPDDDDDDELIYTQQSSSAAESSQQQPRRLLAVSSNKLRVMRKTKVQVDVGLAPKLVVIPERVTGLKTHWVRSLMPGYDQIVVDQRLASVHHYRLVDNLAGLVGNGSDRFLLDKTMHAYRSSLAERVEKFLKEVPQMCNVTANLWTSDTP